MRRWIEKNFVLYLEDGTETEQERWENVQEIVHLCMCVIMGLALLKWGIGV